MSIRDVPEPYAALREDSTVRPVCEVTAWRGAAYMGPVEIVGGTVSDDETTAVRGAVAFQVPNTRANRPVHALHKLGVLGQRVRVRTGLRRARDADPVVWVDHGDYRIIKAEPAGDVIDVDAVGMGKTLEEARWTQDPVVLPAETFKSRVQWMVRPMMVAVFDVRLTDRPIGTASYPDRDRIKGLTEVLEAWPAVAEPGPGNTLLIRPPYAADGDAVELTYRTGEGGTLVSLDPDRDTDPTPNGVIVSSAPESGFTVTAGAMMDIGPNAWGGPAGFKPSFYASPVLTTTEQCRQVAVARLARAQRRTDTVTAEIVPDGRVKVGSVVRLIDGSTDSDAAVRVTKVDHPLTAHDGPGKITGSVISGRLGGVGIDVVNMTSSPLGVGMLSAASGVLVGREIFGAQTAGTWRADVWRNDTAELVYGDDERGKNTACAWWGDGPRSVPGTIAAAGIALGGVPGDQGSGKATVQLLAGTRRPAGGPTVLASEEGPSIPTDDSVAVFLVPDTWLPRIKSGEAGGVGVTTDGATARLTQLGQSMAIQIDWKR